METIVLPIFALISISAIVLFVFALWQFGIFIYHWYFVVTNVTNKYAPVMGPLLLLDEKNFNEIGQEHLKELKTPLKKFLLSFIPCLAFAAIMAYISNGNV